jgi:hypothetical protein
MAPERSRRRCLPALYRKLRQKGAFGNDVTDVSALSGRITAGPRTIGPNGSIVIFQSKGIHQRHTAENGERPLITFVFG